MLKWCCLEQWPWFILALLSLQQSLQDIENKHWIPIVVLEGNCRRGQWQKGLLPQAMGTARLRVTSQWPRTLVRWSHGLRTIGLSFLRSKAIFRAIMATVCCLSGPMADPKPTHHWECNTDLTILGRDEYAKQRWRCRTAMKGQKCWDDRLPWVSSFTCWILCVGLAMGEREFGKVAVGQTWLDLHSTAYCNTF